MTGPSIQDRTGEFQAILGQAQRRLNTSKVSAQRQSLLSDAQRRQANGAAPAGGKRGRSEFAKRAAEIGRGITATTAKLQRLAECKNAPAPFCVFECWISMIVADPSQLEH